MEEDRFKEGLQERGDGRHVGPAGNDEKNK